MLLGNALRGSVIGIRTFFDSIKKDTGRYRYRLALGATRIQALIPYIRECMNAALRPTIATMSTMGIVFLPGMMTGQILGGATPITAIKYQLLIMAAIFTCVNLSVLFTVIFTLPFGFTPYGTLRRDIFR
jgi:putative ABC transport system permease protein